MAVQHKCEACGRKLRGGRWVYSRFTGQRYCWPGTGCLRTKTPNGKKG